MKLNLSDLTERQAGGLAFAAGLAGVEPASYFENIADQWLESYARQAEAAEAGVIRKGLDAVPALKAQALQAGIAVEAAEKAAAVENAETLKR